MITKRGGCNPAEDCVSIFFIIFFYFSIFFLMVDLSVYHGIVAHTQFSIVQSYWLPEARPAFLSQELITASLRADSCAVFTREYKKVD